MSYEFIKDTSEFLASLLELSAVVLLPLLFYFFSFPSVIKLLKAINQDVFYRRRLAAKLVCRAFFRKTHAVTLAKLWLELHYLIRNKSLFYAYLREICPDQQSTRRFLQMLYANGTIPKGDATSARGTAAQSLLREHKAFAFWKALEKNDQEAAQQFIHRKAFQHFWRKYAAGKTNVYAADTVLDINQDFLHHYMTHLQKLYKNGAISHPRKHGESRDKTHENEEEEMFCSSAIIFSFKEGCAARLNLITGLLHHFEEDWRKFIHPFEDVFKETTGLPRDGSPDITAFEKVKLFFRNTADSKKKSLFKHKSGGDNATRQENFYFYTEYHLFTLDCWLVWGPSTPLSAAKARKYLQYGYGDEALSFRLHCNGHLEASEFLITNTALAVKCGVSGKLSCKGDTSIINVMSFSGLPDVKEEGVRGYYSAYFWVAFVLCNKKGLPVFLHEEEWKGFLPFFLHGNAVASRRHKELYFRELAAKAVRNLASLLPLLSDDVHFRYACALDDGISTPERSIRYYVEEYLKEPGNKHLAHHIHVEPPVGVYKEYFTTEKITDKVINPYIEYLKEKQNPAQ